MKTLFFFPWTERRGNRWHAFATENTLFMSEKTGSQRRRAALHRKKEGNMITSCEQGGAFTLGCYFQSHCKNTSRKLRTCGIIYDNHWSTKFPKLHDKKKLGWCVTFPQWVSIYKHKTGLSSGGKTKQKNKTVTPNMSEQSLRNGKKKCLTKLTWKIKT